jgi:hypothetical protein
MAKFFSQKFGGNGIITYLCNVILEENKELAIEKWNEYFGRSVKDEDF